MNNNHLNILKQQLTENSKKKGDEAEELAIDYLTAKNFIIKKKNFHFGKTGEIDIIAEDGQELVFIEVKSARNLAFGAPEFFLTPAKQQKIRKAAQGYLYVNKIENKQCRFDYIAITYINGEPKLNHIKNAF